MNPSHSVDVSLPHHIDSSKASERLTHLLGCERWHVVCHREHQLVVHLSKGEVDRFAVSFECTPPVEKAIYHGSMTSHLAIIPLHGETDLTRDAVERVRLELAGV